MQKRNKLLLDIFIEKVRREYPEDISLVFIYGSEARDDAHSKSDLDLVFVPRTSRGRELSMTFLLRDIGYDFFPMSWERLERIASFDETLVSIVAQGKVVYSASEADEDRFLALQEQIQRTVDGPLTINMLDKASALIEKAMLYCAEMAYSFDYGQVRVCAGGVLSVLSTAVYLLNNTYMQKAEKHRLEELAQLPRLPEHFVKHYLTVIHEKRSDYIRTASWRLLNCVKALYSDMEAELRVCEAPQSLLPGTYEEMVCNWKNKLLTAIHDNDAHYAYVTAVNYQAMLDEVSRRGGLPRMDILKSFQADNLPALRKAIVEVEKRYLKMLYENDVAITQFDTTDAFRSAMLSAEE